MRFILILVFLILAQPAFCKKEKLYECSEIKNGIEKDYYLGKKIKREVNCLNGLWHGIAKHYYKNGNLEAVGNFQNGKVQRNYKAQYKNGNPKEECCLGGFLKNYY